MEAKESTGDRLVRAAERLFAKHGIAAVSLREINRESGAKNAVALQYHFGDRAGLLRAVVGKHLPSIEARRHQLLDDYEAGGEESLRALAAALVVPLAEKLSDADGGPEYLQIHAELMNLPRHGEASESGNDSIQRWRALVAPFLQESAVRLHRRFTVMRFAAAELGRRAASAPHTDDRLFVSDLTDLVEGLLVAPTSEATIELADARDVARRRRTPTG